MSGKLFCEDCGLAYTDPAWADVVIPDAYWLAIMGRQGGVLCFNCMNARLVRAGLDHVPATINSGPMCQDIAIDMNQRPGAQPLTARPGG